MKLKIEKSLKKLTDDEVKKRLRDLKIVQEDIARTEEIIFDIESEIADYDAKVNSGKELNEKEQINFENLKISWSKESNSLDELKKEKKEIEKSLDEFSKTRMNLLEAGSKERSDKQKNYFWLIAMLGGLLVGTWLEKDGCLTTQTFRRANGNIR